MAKGNKIILGLVGLSSLGILVLGLAFAEKTQPPVLETKGDAKMEVVGGRKHDWGQIDIDGGNVEKVFQINSLGDADLEVTNFKTSCMCTEVQVSIDKEESPVFGMHSRSGWKGVIKTGESAYIRVVFDPLFHGPQAVGPITRLVSFNTNDSQNPSVEFMLTGNVVSLDDQ